MLARLTVLFVVFPETDHQARNDHGRFVLGVCGDDGKVRRLVAKNVSENGSDGTEQKGSTTYVVRNAPDADHQKDGREQVPKWTPLACTHTHTLI